MPTTISFDDWMKQVDHILSDEYCGFDTNDLADCSYRDWYDDGLTPLEATKKVIRYNGGSDECDEVDYDD
jgi:hypothetical protein